MQTQTTYDGNVTATGNVTASAFVGNGASITAIDGSHVSLTGAGGDLASWDPITEILTHESQATAAQGGTGLDSSTSTGFPYVTAGTWIIDNSPTITVNANASAGTVYGYIQTSDNTPTTACTVDIAASATNTKTSTNMVITASAGRGTDDTVTINTENWFDEYEVTYIAGSPPTVVITQVSETKSGTLPAYAITVTNTGSTLNIMVTGAAATAVNWVVKVEYVKVSFTSTS